MKKYTALLLLVMMLINFSLYAKKLASLPEVQIPTRIMVYKGRLLVADHKIRLHMYIMKDFSYKLLATRGQGPQEILSPPDFVAYGDNFYIYSLGKGMFFSLDGTLKDEFKIDFSINKALPIGKNYVVSDLSPSAKDGTTADQVSINEYSSQNGFQFKKMIYYRVRKFGKNRSKNDYPLIKPFFGFFIEDEKVFIGNTEMGGLFEIYDSQGKEVRRFHIDLKPVKISNQFKKEYLEMAEQIPSFSIVKSMYNTYFPEYFPAYYRFAVGNQKIYILTYNKKNKDREVLITNYYGKILKQSYVPWIENFVHTNFSIEDDKFYYIKENEDTEEWELHVEDIK